MGNSGLVEIQAEGFSKSRPPMLSFRTDIVIQSYHHLLVHKARLKFKACFLVIQAGDELLRPSNNSQAEQRLLLHPMGTTATSKVSSREGDVWHLSQVKAEASQWGYSSLCQLLGQHRLGQPSGRLPVPN